MTNNGIWADKFIKREQLPAGDLAQRFNIQNPRTHPETQRQATESSLDTVGWIDEISLSTNGNGPPSLADNPDAVMFDGHERVEIALVRGGPDVLVPVRWYQLTPEETDFALLAKDQTSAMAQIDPAKMAALMERTKAMTEAPGLQGMLERLKEQVADGLLADGNGAGSDTEPQIDKAAELQEKWQVQPGQLWELGELHRVICGDCTDAAVVERVMGGEKAVLLHADPPYGMGKENEGIANDNLYREKLDAFQMQWWGVCRRWLEDNASAYIWGNAEDLWRLWYVGGLKGSERLTFRNEIVWDKKSGQGMLSDAHRMYPTGSERCFFFMLGEQGFNNNADNYWEGWEPIRAYFQGEIEKMEWSRKDINSIFETANNGGGMASHFISGSQFHFPTEEKYKKLQTAAKGDAFKREYDDLKREYDDLKREFYSTRAYFDNTHDNMTDVWQFSRVQGEERHGHATPKPVDMIERIVKSSSPDGAIVYCPFLGSGTDLIACHNLNRKARAIEISPAYVGVSLQRFLDHTGIQPRLLETVGAETS